MIHNIYLEITSTCNYKCTFCPHLKMKRSKLHMKEELAYKALDEIKSAKVGKKIYFNYLGEPLISPILFDCLEYAKKIGLSSHIVTNGSLLNKENIKKIAKSGLASIKVSYETPDDESYKLRGNNFYTTQEILNNTINLIKALKNKKTEIGIVLMTTGGKNTKIMEDISIINTMEELQELGLGLYNKISKVTKLYKYEEIKKEIKKTSWDRMNSFIYLNDTIFLAIRPVFNWGNLLNPKKVYPKKYGHCDQALKKEMGILVNGDVVLCCIDTEGETSIGNVSNQSLKKILNSKKAKSIIRDFDNGILQIKKCQECKGTTSYTEYLIDTIKYKAKNLF